MLETRAALMAIAVQQALLSAALMVVVPMTILSAVGTTGVADQVSA